MELLLKKSDVYDNAGKATLPYFVGLLINDPVATIFQKRHLSKVTRMCGHINEEIRKEHADLQENFAEKDEAGKPVIEKEKVNTPQGPIETEKFKFGEKQREFTAEYTKLLEEEVKIDLEEKTANVLKDCLTKVDPKSVNTQTVDIFSALCEAMDIDPESHPEQVPAGK